MANNPLDAFEVGQKIGKAKRSTFGMTSDTLMDNFKTGQEAQAKMAPSLAAIGYKEKLERERPLDEKQKAEMELTRQKSDYFKKMALGPQGISENGDLVLDRVSPQGPTYVNQKARLQMKTAASEATQLPKLDRAFDAVQQLKNQYQSALNPVSIPRGSNPLFSMIQKGAQGATSKIGAISGSNPDMNRYLANKNGFASLLSKGGFMEAGVLTNEDINRMTNILPNEYSTKEEADIAWREVENILSSARKRFESMSGGQPRADMAPDASTADTANDDEETMFQKLKARYGTK